MRFTVRVEAGEHRFDASVRAGVPTTAVGLLALGLAGPADATFPDPVRRVRFTVRVEAGEHRFDASVRAGVPTTAVGLLALG
ncbi:hypothetical protein, partial [Micromonospora sp. 4G55]|uniref:hypothetical protein n=1 Tax=Micromonospora sp. 4G55 TaxID=2806102 RepID=UPI001A577EB9